MGASNEQKAIVHLGAGHSAYGGADACLNGTYDNVAPSSTLGAGASTKTQIEGNRIGMVGSHWETSESAGVIGVKSGTTKKDAVVTTGSKDVFVEGAPAARVQDPTTQNSANSAGAVKPQVIKPSNESVEERAKKRCKLTSWKATNGKAELGWPGRDKTGQPNYLELWDTDTVTFTSTRHDITKTPHEVNPKCEMSPHTEWVANGKVFPTYMRSEEKRDKGTETFEVPANLVTEAFTAPGALADALNGDAAGFAGKVLSKFATNDGELRSEAGEHVGGLGRQDYGGSSAAPKAGYAGGEKFDGTKVEGLTKTPDPKNEPIRGATDMGGFKGDVRALMFFAWWWIKPPEIKVTATSCGGALDATLKVFSNQKTKFGYEWGSPFAKKKSIDGKKLRETLEAKEAAEAARDQARADKQAATAAGDAKVASGLALLDNAANIGGTNRSARKGQQRATRRAEKAFDKAMDEFAKAEAALAKFSAAQAQLDNIQNTLKTLDQTFSILQKVADVSGVPLTYELCKDLTLDVEFSYDRTDDRESQRGWRWYTTATMGQTWKFGLRCSTLVGLSWKAYFSLLQLATFYIPFLANMLRKFRIFRVDLFVAVSFKVGLGATFQKTRHDEFTISGDVSAGFTPTIGMVMGGAGIDVVQMSAWMPSEAKYSVAPPKTKGAIFKGTPSFRCNANYRAVIFPDRWWEIEAAAGAIPGFRYYWNLDGKFYNEPFALPA